MLLVEESELETYISRISKNDESLTEVRFRGELSLEQFQRLGFALSYNTQLTSISLEDVIIPDDECLAALLNGLAKNKTIQSLDLSGCFYNDEDEIDIDVELIANFIRDNKTLITLHLDNNTLTNDHGILIAQALKSNSSLLYFYINENFIENKGMKVFGEMLAANKTLLGLHINTNDFDAAGAVHLAKGLQSNSALEVLDVSFNSIGDEGVSALAAMLMTNSHLLRLFIDDTYFASIGMAALAKAMAVNQTLIELDVSHNQLGASGFESVYRLLKAAKGLQEFGMKDVGLNDEVVALLGGAIEDNHSLMHLEMGGSNLTFQGWMAFVGAMQKNTFMQSLSLSTTAMKPKNLVAILSLFEKNIALRHLNLSECGVDSRMMLILSDFLMKNGSLLELMLTGNPLGDAGAVAIADALRANKTLRLLELSHCEISDDGLSTIAKAFPHNQTLRQIGLSGNLLTASVEAMLLEYLEQNQGLIELPYNLQSQFSITPSTIAELDFDSKEDSISTRRSPVTSEDSAEEKEAIPLATKITEILDRNFAALYQYREGLREKVKESMDVVEPLLIEPLQDIIVSYAQEPLRLSSDDEKFVQGVMIALREYKDNASDLSQERIVGKLNNLVKAVHNDPADNKKLLELKKIVKNIIAANNESSLTFWQNHGDLVTLLSRHIPVQASTRDLESKNPSPGSSLSL